LAIFRLDEGDPKDAVEILPEMLTVFYLLGGWWGSRRANRVFPALHSPISYNGR
jgi:hypothetical protein